jgi:GDPmannose 4,6-dehydratase
MLQQANLEDFVIATGIQYSVRDFLNAAAKKLGMQIRWEGTGISEKGVDTDGRVIVEVDPRYFRRTEPVNAYVFLRPSGSLQPHSRFLRR